MPKFEKSPPALVARFDAVAARHQAAQRRQMFGYPTLFVGGNFAAGLFADRWVVRMAPSDTDALLMLDDAQPFKPMAGRPMTGWTLLPRAVVDDDEALDRWLGRAFAFAGSLPAKP